MLDLFHAQPFTAVCIGPSEKVRHLIDHKHGNVISGAQLLQLGGHAQKLLTPVAAEKQATICETLFPSHNVAAGCLAIPSTDLCEKSCSFPAWSVRNMPATESSTINFASPFSNFGRNV